MNYPWILSIINLFASKKTANVLAGVLSLLFASLVTYKLSPVPVSHHWHGIENVVLTDDPNLATSQELWDEEVARRFPDAAIVFAHGNTVVGEWIMMTPDGIKKVTDVANSLVAQYPGREIVFITCNPGHHVINIPHVHTALANVWIIPDRYQSGILFAPRILMEPEAVGNIFEFN